MSRRRAQRGTGSRVGGGRLRVDAARAVGKLRDYQLADPAMWALEAVRAGAAMGASAIHVDGDADDVWVAWEGEPLAPTELTRLLDELVSPGAESERRPLRLLATAINTALGLGPRYVDVYSIESGAGVRARYAPGLLTTGVEGAAEGLRNLTATPAALPAGAPAIARGAVVHLRRFPALEALSLLATGQEPREVRLARRACEDFPLPLRIGHGPLARHHAPGDLLRVRLDPGALGEGHDAFLAITELARLEPYVDYAELGVVLATQPLELGLVAVPGAHVPIRARIDAPRLPTNASRSAIRRDEAWCRRTEELLAGALPELVARLLRELGPDAEAEWTPKALARLRAAALVLAAVPVAGADWRERVLTGAPEVLAPLLDAPLARDAIGRPRSIRELARSGHRVAHTGAEPLPADLAPWVGDVPWIPPGDPLARLWGGSPPPTAVALVHQARASRDARMRWLARPIAEPTLGPDASHLAVVPLQLPGPSARSCIPASVLGIEGLRGEIALLPPIAARGEITLLVDGRETEVARRNSPVPFRAIATAQSLRLVPSHDAVDDDDAKRAVLRACSAAVVVGCEAIARQAQGRRAPQGETARLLGEPPRTAAALVRGGTRLALTVLEQATKDGRAAFLASKSPLLSAPAWPTTSGALASIDAIVQSARGTPGVVGWVAHAPSRTFELEGRVVLVLDEHERELIELLIGAESLVDYRGRCEPPPSAGAIARELRARCVAVLAFERPGRRGAIGWTRSTAGSTTLSHLGHELSSRSPTSGTAVPAHVAIDDDHLVPARDWRSLRDPARRRDDEDAALETELAAALIDALVGHERADLLAPSMLTDAVDLLFTALARMSATARAPIRPERIALLREVPLFRRVFASGRATMTQACAALGGELVYVPPEIAAGAGLPLAGFDPVVLDGTAVQGVAALFGARIRNGTEELRRRRAEALREARLASLLSGPALPLALPDCRPVVQVTGQGVGGLLGLARRRSDRTEIQVRIEGRPLCGTDEPLPGLEAVVDGDPALADDTLRALSDAGLSRVRGAIRDASARLIIELASTLDRPLAHDERALRLVRAWAESAADRKRGIAKKVLAALRTTPIFATVQGGRASLEDATTGKQVRIAEPVDRWLEPVEGEAPTLVDRPILACSASETDPVRATLAAIAEHGLRNVTNDVRRVIAARRVKHGIAGRPRVTHTVDERFRWTLESLAETAPASEKAAFEGLGFGEIGFVREGPSTIALFEAGTRLQTLELDIRPWVAVACEPAAIRVGDRGLAPKDRERLDTMARTVVARAMRRLVETISHADLPEWLRLELRTCALVGGSAHLAAISDVPVFQTARGGWISPAAVQSQAQRFGQVWWTSAPAAPEPLDPERVVLRLEANEARQLEPWAACLRADEELRLDAIARANRDRAPLASIGPAYQDAALALASAQLVERHGTVLALHPAHVATRGLHAHRGRRPLGIVGDGSSWPARAWVDDDALTPDRTWSAPIDDAALQRARAEVAEICETALAATFESPRGVLASVAVDRALSDAAVGARGVRARGVLAIPVGDEPSIGVIDAVDESERTATTPVPHDFQPRALPISGRLVITGVAGPGARAALAAIARAAYARMLRTIGARLAADRSPDRDLDVAELVRAATLGCLDDARDETASARALELGFVVGDDRSLGTLADALARGDRVLAIPAEQRAEAATLARDLGFTGTVIVDDGTLAARRLITNARVVPLGRLLADAILVADEEPAPEPRPAASPAPQPPRPSSPPVPPPELTLPGTIASRIAERGATASPIPITVDLLASAPLASRRGGGEVELALRHELVRALERRLRDEGAHDDAITILAAHVIGVAVRGDDDAARVQLDAIARLLVE